MRIIHIITGLQKAAGTSVFCGEISNGLVLSGHEVTIAVRNPTQEDIYPLDPRVKLVSIASILRNSNFKIQDSNDLIIHIHAIWAPVLHKVSNWAHKHGLPVVWSPHGMLTPWAMDNKKWKKTLGWWLYQKRDLGRAALIHATAQSEIEDIRRMGLMNKIVVAPLGVDVNRCVENIDRAEEREKTLLFVSRVHRKKGLLNLARAWAILKQEYSTVSPCLGKWKVRIVGPDQEGYTAEVKVACERLGVRHDWEFVGPKYGAELRQEYANADLFVLPTYSENFGSVIIEALAHGLPVITTKGAPWKELETHKCGWWVDIGVQPLVAALKNFMQLDNAQLREMGARGRALVEEKYTWNAVVKAIERGYEDILK